MRLYEVITTIEAMSFHRYNTLIQFYRENGFKELSGYRGRFNASFYRESETVAEKVFVIYRNNTIG